MKFAVIGPIEPYKGGIAHYNSLLIKYLGKDHSIQVISWKRRIPQFFYPGNQLLSSDEKADVKKDSRFVLDSFNPLTWYKAARMILNGEADVLIVHWVTPFLAPVLGFILWFVKKTRNVETLAICHNVLAHETRMVDNLLTKFVFRQIDQFLVNSASDQHLVKRIVPHANVSLGFHPTYVTFKKKWNGKRNPKSLNLRKSVILFFGFVRRYKGLSYLLQAMPRILKFVDCDLLIVGEFWHDKEHYLKMIRSLSLTKNVKIVDEYVPDDNVGSYFSMADVVVLPYVTATQSGIVQIAYGFGKPVITTTVGGLPDVVDDGVTGLLVKPKNSLDLANAIIRFYESDMRSSCEKAVQERVDSYSWSRYISLIENTVRIRKK